MNRERLYAILGLRRKHESDGEAILVQTVLDPYIGRTLVGPAGNVLAYVNTIEGPNGEVSRTLFSCHIDTVVVADAKEVNNYILIDDEEQILYGDGNTLGADDGAGIALLLEMIDAKVPGTYVFHRGEECGGIGSSGVATHHVGFLSCFDRAIAFDRRGTHSVITHQGSERCCSEDFANALAWKLNSEDYFFAPDDGGSFTDTKNYVDVIPECTNVSVGYDREHGIKESLDLKFLDALVKACIETDWESLPTARVAGSIEYLDSGLSWWNKSTPSKPTKSISDWDDRDDDLSDYYRGYEGSTVDPWDLYDLPTETLVDYVSQLRITDLTDFCTDYPDLAAEVIAELTYAGVYGDREDEEEKPVANTLTKAVQ